MDELSYTLSSDTCRPTVLFLHGFMSSSEDWRDAVATLDERWCCVAVDLPGHGASLGLPAEDYTVEGTTRLLRRFSDKTSLSEGAGQHTPTSD